MDNLPDFTTTYLPIIIATITGLIGTGLGIYNFIQRQKDRQVKAHIEKVKELDHRIRKIRVRFVNKIIEKCNVSFNNKMLVWDGTEGQIYFTIFEGSARNAVIPDDIFTEDADVIVRADKKVIKRLKFKDMELGT